MRFEEILVALTAGAGVIWLIDTALFKSKRLASATGEDKTAKEPIWVEYSRSFFPVLLLVLVLRSFLAEPFRIPTGSMRPTLLDGDFILVNKYDYGLRLPILGTTLVPIGKPHRGDVIVFRHGPDKDLIKRVVGLPGDKIRYQDKKLYINNKPVETFFKGRVQDGAIPAEESLEKLNDASHRIYIYPHRLLNYNHEDITVPEDSYFVMGDNRDNSEDSRFWGFVKDKDVLGRAFAAWMSWDSEFSDVRWQRIGKTLDEL